MLTTEERKKAHLTFMAAALAAELKKEPGKCKDLQRLATCALEAASFALAAYERLWEESEPSHL